MEAYRVNKIARYAVCNNALFRLTKLLKFRGKKEKNFNYIKRFTPIKFLVPITIICIFFNRCGTLKLIKL